MPAASEADTPPHRYDAAMAAEIESRWQAHWDTNGIYNTPKEAGEPATGGAAMSKLFIMDMFPYPSGSGLHVGHPLGYIATDVYTRFKRMCGFNVLYTMGFDAFGLPAEEHARQTGQHPRVNTEANIANMRRQLGRLGLGHDKSRSIATTDTDYYRWTQWIFLQIFNSWFDAEAGRARPISELIGEFESGVRPVPGARPWEALSEAEQREAVDGHRLAYMADAPVNWCPTLGTVLANEEVTAQGRSERGNHEVFKRPLRQWMMRITAYADRLLEDLDRLDWPESVKTMQRNWIGRSEGSLISFQTTDSRPGPMHAIEVFTTRPDTLFGTTYMVLAPEHPLVDELTADAWPAGTPYSWTGGAATPGEAVDAYRARAAELSDEDRGDSKSGVFLGTLALVPLTAPHEREDLREDLTESGEPADFTLSRLDTEDGNGRHSTASGPWGVGGTGRGPWGRGTWVPVFVADYVLMGYGTGAVMGVPGEDQRDREFAEAYGLRVVRTVQPPPDHPGDKAYTGDGPSIHSDFLDGLDVEASNGAHR